MQLKKRKNVLDETLVDPHLKGIPGLGTLTVRGLSGSDLEALGGEADGTLDAEVLGLGALEELGADLLEGLDLAGGEGDADLVDLLEEEKKFLVSETMRPKRMGERYATSKTYGGLAEVLLALLVRHLDGLVWGSRWFRWIGL